MARHRDRYAHLRPPRPRQCFRSDGQPKRPLVQPAAEQIAVDLGEGYQAYECSRCGSWHVGRQKREAT